MLLDCHQYDHTRQQLSSLLNLSLPDIQRLLSVIKPAQNRKQYLAIAITKLVICNQIVYEEKLTPQQAWDKVRREYDKNKQIVGVD